MYNKIDASGNLVKGHGELFMVKSIGVKSNGNINSNIIDYNNFNEDDESDESAASTNSTSFIKLFFHLAHVTCFSPFHITHGLEKSIRIIRSNFIFLTIHLIMILVGLFYYTYGIRKTVLDIFKAKGNLLLVKYFVLMYQASKLARSALRLGLWGKRETFAKLHHLIQNSTLCLKLRHYDIQKFAVLCIIHFSMMVLLITGSHGKSTGSIFNGDFMGLANGFVRQGKQMTFMSKVKMTNYTSLSELSVNEILYGVFAFTIMTSVRLEEVQTWLLIMISCICLRGATKSFEKHLNLSTQNSRSLVLEKFCELKEMSTYINDCVGTWIFIYILNYTFYLPIRFNTILTTPDWTERVSLIFRLIIAVVIIIMACEISRKMDRFKDWVLDRKRNGFYTNEEIQWIYMNLTEKSVGISGRFFNVNYSFIGATAAILMTYFVIIIQSEGTIDLSDADEIKSLCNSLKL